MVTQMPLTFYKTKLLAYTLGMLLLAPLAASAKIGEVTKQVGQDASISRDAGTIIADITNIKGTTIELVEWLMAVLIECIWCTNSFFFLLGSEFFHCF